jgi:acetyltransferase-like isoleucine patch superfamily enzyme
VATLNRSALEAIGFSSVGSNVLISDRASIYGASRIDIGNNVRIDDFCVLSAGAGGIVIGNYIHLAVYSSLIGRGRITLNDFCNISSRVSIYSSSDDYTGATMTNPMVPEEFTGVTHADVTLGRHVIVGSGSVVLPGVTLMDGAAVGALSLVRDDCQAYGVYAGTPANYVRERKREMLDAEKRLLASIRRSDVP